jgi:eukaryotic-like serine/threonine-protein kinase
VNKERLRGLLPPEIHGELDRLVTEYLSTGLPQDPTEFMTWLHLSGRISAVGLRDALSSVDVSVTLSEPGPDDRQIAVPTGGPSRHRYLGLLGKGAMGEVHIARDETLNRNVAIKKMISRYARHRVGNARFQTEVQITAQLDHPSIVPVYSFEQAEDGLPAYSMKLVRGATLAEFIAVARKAYDAQQRPDTEHDLPARLDVFLQICNAMHYAHSRGVIHRDLKPDNVMIGPFHEVIVMDWGIAKLVGGGELPVDDTTPVADAAITEPARASLTTIGAAVGTPSYMSPEQAQGRNEDLTAASDQFALGLLLFEMVSLRRAYVGPTGPAVLVKAAHGKTERLAHLSPTERIPRELAGIIAKATAYEPKDRYKDVAALADDVRRFLRDEAVVAAPDRGLQVLTRWVSHHREITLSIGFVLLLLMVMGAFGAVVTVQQVAEAERIAAEEHEQALQSFTTAVGRHAHRIDTEFTRYETLLEGLAQGAQATLAQPQAPQPYWLPEQIAVGIGPADLAPAKYYQADRVAFSTPDVMTSPGLDTTRIPERMAQLVALRPILWQTIKRSLPGFEKLSDSAAQSIIRTDGAPVLWTYVVTEEGVIVSLPAVWRYPAGYDPIKTDWYPEGMENDGPYWFSAGLDESGMGLLVSCTRRIYAPDGRPIGLAALDVGIAHILSTLIDPPDMRAPVESFLVDKNGQIVASSNLKVFQEEPKPFPYVDLLERARAGEPIGRIEHYKPAGDKLVAWSTLDAMGFVYLVMGDGDALLRE